MKSHNASIRDGGRFSMFLHIFHREFCSRLLLHPLDRRVPSHDSDCDEHRRGFEHVEAPLVTEGIAVNPKPELDDSIDRSYLVGECY